MGAIEYVREATITYGPAKRAKRGRVASSADAVPVIREQIADRCVEHFVAIALDGRNRPIAWGTIGVGNVSGCPVDVGAVLRLGILSGARALIVAHNHPSGDPSPSAEDLTLTERLVSAAALVGLQILDHVIVAEDGHFSFLDAGLLAKRGGRS